MVRRVVSAGIVLCLSLAGCAMTPGEQTMAGYVPPAGSYKLIVMRPDIAVSLLTAGGQLEQREDWTNTAREHVLDSLKAQQERQGGAMQIALKNSDAGGDETAIVELHKLHEVVGQSILMHKFSPGLSLPTKRKGVFDWTLGELAIDYGRKSGYDYALFLYARDSFSSGGRVALQAVGALGCIVGLCVLPSGGSQQAFASLVDLKSGQVAWFNFRQSSTGDIRTRDGADALVAKLLESMSAGPPEKPKKGA
jgi:hypothetical protein